MIPFLVASPYKPSFVTLIGRVCTVSRCNLQDYSLFLHLYSDLGKSGYTYTFSVRFFFQ